MLCPNCQHPFDDQQLTCAACGQASARAALEDLQKLEYLATWLDEHQDELAAPGFRRLRQDAEQQLVVLRGAARPRLAAAPAAPAVTAPARIAARPPEQVAWDLALARNTLDLMKTWEGMNVLGKRSAEMLRGLLISQSQHLREELAGRPAGAPAIYEPDVIEYALQGLSEGNWSTVIEPRDRASLTRFLERRRQMLRTPPAPARPAAAVTPPPAVSQPAPVAAPASLVQIPAPPPSQPAPAPVTPPVVAAPPLVAALPVIAALPRPAPTPRPVTPPSPPIDWGKVWERSWQLVVSGALLRGLLYLGALMIVASAVVLVVRFWNNFPAWLQIGFVAAVPLTFYAGGFVLRRLKIPVAGSVFTGIGALLVAVDLAAVYQLAGLARVIELPLYWLGASLVCAALYLFTLYRARGEFFGYLTLIGAGNVGVALAVALHLRPEWWVTAGAAVGLGSVAVAGALKGRGGRWPELGRPAHYFAQLTLPLAVFLAVAVSIFDAASTAAGLSATLALVALGYGGLAWRFGYDLAELAAVGSSLFALGLALNAAGVPNTWLAGAGALLAAGYAVAGRWRSQTAVRRGVRLAWYGAAGLLALMALVFGLVTLFTDLWAGVIGLVLLDAVLAGWAPLFRRPVFTFAAAALFVVPFTAAAARWLTDAAWMPVIGWVAVAWTVLSLAYLALAVVLRPAEQHTRWLYLWAHALTFLAAGPLVGVFVLLALGTITAPDSSLVMLLAGAGALAVYGVSAALHAGGQHAGLSRWVAGLKPYHEAAFLWPLGALLPAELAIAWWRWAQPQPASWAWFGVALAGLSFVYVLGGQWLARWQSARHGQAYRLPWQTLAYVLAAAGSAAALVFGPRLALPIALYLSVASLAALSATHRRWLETLLAAALFVAPVQLTLQLTALPGSAYALAYALLAALVYYPLGLRLRRAGAQFCWAVLGVGYALAAGAVGLALAGRAAAPDTALPWAGVAAPLVVLALLWASSYHLRRAAFAWAAALVLYGFTWQALAWLAVPPAFTAAAWVGLAFAALLAGRALALLLREGHWLRAHANPLQLLSAGVCLLGLGLTAAATGHVLTSLFGRPAVATQADQFAAILAQGLAVGLVCLAARLYHSRWPMWIAPVLSFFPVTLFFVAYSGGLLGQSLTIPQFGLVWLGLGLAQLLAAVLLDRHPARYAHGLYAMGYALIVFAAQWTVLDRPAQLMVLGAGVLVALASQALAHTGRHHSFDDLINWFWADANPAAPNADPRGARALFLFAAAYAFPLWLALLLAQLGAAPSGQGLGLAALAVVYVGLGRLARRLRPEYAWPFYSAGYALSIIGPVLALGNERVLIYTLALTAGLYAASAFLFEEAFWLLFANALTALIALLVLHVNGQANPQWLGLVFIGLALFDVALAQFFRRGTLAGRRVENFEMACLAPGYLLSALALAAAASLAWLAAPAGWSPEALRWVGSGVFGAAVALYAFSAWRYRALPFIYLAAGLAAVPYALLLRQLPIPADWLGLAWLPLIVGYILGARRAFHRAPLPGNPLSHWAMPFYLLAYALTVPMLVQSFASPLATALAYGAAALVYGGSALLYRRPAWLFPALLALHLGVLATFALVPSSQPAYTVSEPMVALTGLMATAGVLLARRALGPGDHNWRERIGAIWALPFLVFAALDVLVWQALAAASPETGLFVAVANALLLAMLAGLWLDQPLAYGALALVALAATYVLALARVPFYHTTGLAWLAGLGFGFYLTARLAGLASGRRLGRLWQPPLSHAAIVLAALATVGMFTAQALDGAAAAAVLGLAGAQAIGEAYRLRRLRLGYAGVALLLAAWAVLLLSNNVAQPQWYALPAGLYLMGIGYLERRIGRKPLAVLIEALGLAVLLVTTFTQSLDGGAAGLPYFILLIVEAMGAVAWGALRRLKSPFFIGLAANALNVLAQLVLLFAGPSTLIRWLIIGGTGLFIVAAAVFVERQRERLLTQATAWREALAAWD